MTVRFEYIEVSLFRLYKAFRLLYFQLSLDLSISRKIFFQLNSKFYFQPLYFQIKTFQLLDHSNFSIIPTSHLPVRSIFSTEVISSFWSQMINNYDLVDENTWLLKFCLFDFRCIINRWRNSRKNKTEVDRRNSWRAWFATVSSGLQVSIICKPIIILMMSL